MEFIETSTEVSWAEAQWSHEVSIPDLVLKILGLALRINIIVL